jgi:probable F420-dependent oxidoreductase
MRHGVVFPTTSIGTDIGALRDFVQGVEALNFHHIVAYDHVLGATHEGREPPLNGPYNQFDDFHEPLVFFSWVAAMTKSIHLFPAVIVAPQRQTALLAKQACELQNLSEGRLRLGIGVGWNWVEYEALNSDFRSRGKIIEEQVDVMRQLWAQELVTFRGRFHTIDRAGISPRPNTTIPVWFGGYTVSALKRSVHFKAGHIFGHLNDGVLSLAAQLRDLLSKSSQAPGSMPTEAIFDYSQPREMWSTWVRNWQEAGGTDLAIRTMTTKNVKPSGCITVDDHLAAFADWRDHLILEGLW